MFEAFKRSRNIGAIVYAAYLLLIASKRECRAYECEHRSFEYIRIIGYNGRWIMSASEIHSRCVCNALQIPDEFA